MRPCLWQGRNNIVSGRWSTGGKAPKAAERPSTIGSPPVSVRIGSIFEDSPIPLGKWLLAIHLMCSSKKGISSNQLKRELGISYQSAWFLTHRIRLAMTVDPLKSLLGSGENAIVEIDETFVGGKVANNMHRNKTTAAVRKTIVMTLDECKVL